MENQQAELPLFPLDTVLYPGGWLPLRIFEPRYLEMIRDCARSGSGFGIVCRLTDEAGEPGVHAGIGTEAVIGDFYTTDDGLLGITALGRRRFRVEAETRRPGGLIVGTVEWLTEPESRPVPPQFGALSGLLNELVRRVGKDYPVEADPDNAVTLAWRLAELLPFDADVRQLLLETHDPLARLEHLLSMMESDEED